MSAPPVAEVHHTEAPPIFSQHQNQQQLQQQPQQQQYQASPAHEQQLPAATLFTPVAHVDAVVAARAITPVKAPEASVQMQRLFSQPKEPAAANPYFTQTAPQPQQHAPQSSAMAFFHQPAALAPQTSLPPLVQTQQQAPFNFAPPTVLDNDLEEIPKFPDTLPSVPSVASISAGTTVSTDPSPAPVHVPQPSAQAPAVAEPPKEQPALPPVVSAVHTEETSDAPASSLFGDAEEPPFTHASAHEGQSHQTSAISLFGNTTSNPPQQPTHVTAAASLFGPAPTEPSQVPPSLVQQPPIQQQSQQQQAPPPTQQQHAPVPLFSAHADSLPRAAPPMFAVPPSSQYAQPPPSINAPYASPISAYEQSTPAGPPVFHQQQVCGEPNVWLDNECVQCAAGAVPAVHTQGA